MIDKSDEVESHVLAEWTINCHNDATGTHLSTVKIRINNGFLINVGL